MNRSNTGNATAKSSASSPQPRGSSAGWKERSLRRSLGSARNRKIDKSRRVVEAARELLAEVQGTTFTVQQVVERAGVSLHTFYLHFEGKDELLVALLEEETRAMVGQYREAIESLRSPIKRIRAIVAMSFEAATASRSEGAYRALLMEHMKLAKNNPGELHQALLPIVDLFVDELRAGMKEGTVRDEDPRRLAIQVFQNLSAQIQYELTSIRREDEPEIRTDHVWEFIRRAIKA